MQMFVRTMTIALVVLGSIASAQGTKQKPPAKDKKAEKPASQPAPEQPQTRPSEVIGDTKAEEESKEIASHLGKEFHYFETDDFTWCTTIPESRMKPIAEGAENVYKKFAADAGVKSWRELFDGQRAMGILVPSKREYDQFIEWYAQKYPVWDKKKWAESKMSTNYLFTASTRPTVVTHVKPNDDDFLRQIMAHMTGHEVVNRYKYHNNFIPAWIEEGAAIYYEGEVCAKVACRCFSGSFYGTKEPTDPTAVKGVPLDKWKGKAKGDIVSSRAKNITALWRLQLGELTAEDAEKCYAVVHWMASQPGKFPEFLAAMKKKWPKEVNSQFSEPKGKAQEEAFKQVYNLTMDQVEDAVRQHVKGKF